MGKGLIALALGLGLLTGAALMVVVDTDIVPPAWRTGWLLSPVTAAGAAVVGLLAGGFLLVARHAGFRRRFPNTAVFLRQLEWLWTMALFGICLGSLGYPLVAQPLKFWYLIRKVESAKTPAEERRAFLLARRWGRLWEVDIHEPPRHWFDWQQLDAAVRDPKRTLIVRLEWLEVRPSGVPYRASRTLTEKSNIYVLLGR